MTRGAIEYGPEWRDGCVFGYGKKDKAQPIDKTLEAIVREALSLGWSGGCPRARSLIEQDPELMMKRYAETNFWFLRVINLVHYRLDNPRLYNVLALSKPRLPDEPVGVHEALSVPRSHLSRISPMSAIEGYSTPRILLEIPEETRIEALRQAVKLTGTEPSHFLAHLAETAVQMKAKPEMVLHHVYAQGVLEEENCRRNYIELAESLRRCAPTVWNTYIQLPQSQRVELAIAEVPR